MKKIILFLFLLLLLVVLYALFSSSKIERATEVTITKIESLEKEEAFEEELALLEEIDEEIEENLTLASIEDNETEELISKEVVPKMVENDALDIMVENTIEEVSKNFLPKKNIAPVSAIDMPKNVISQLNIGDVVSLPYMGTGQFDAKIIAKSTHKNGSVTVSGNLVDSDNKYSVVLTEGKNMSFGTVTTPNGSYEIETRNGQGYVYSTDAIDREWIDYGKKDTLEPDRHEH